jgi:hypothetical protein
MSSFFFSFEGITAPHSIDVEEEEGAHGTAGITASFEEGAHGRHNG